MNIKNYRVDIMKTMQPALRPYLETIEKQCLPLTKKSLVQLILSLARQVDSERRSIFMQSFYSCLPDGEQQQTEPRRKDATELVIEIEELREEIEARVESIYDGTYWDDPDDDDWDDSCYHDEDPHLINEYQKEALVEYFSKANHYFMHGGKKEAKKIYGALFSLISEVEEDGYSLPDFDIDLGEAGARFVRCVYEFSSGNERLEAMLEIMTEDLLNTPPLLIDIIDAETDDLDNFDSFLSSWRVALTEYDFRIERQADLLLEATFLQNGSKSVGELARSWGTEQPCGYLYWLHGLEREENWQGLRNISNEALTLLPYGLDREKVAHYLVKAGKQLADDKTTLAGYREQFKSEPRTSRLLNLVTEANRQQLREKELGKICIFLAEKEQTFGEKKLLIKSLLMAGDIDRAFAICNQDKAVGWSSSDGTALIYGAVLYLLSGADELCTTIHNHMEYYSESDRVYFDRYGDRSVESETSDLKEILFGLQNVDTTSLELDRYRQWVWDIGQKRVNYIVSNTHRGAYERAAMTLCSLAESIAVQGDKDEAQALLREYCRVRYNRHTAFRGEMRGVVGKSLVLFGMAGGL